MFDRLSRIGGAALLAGSAGLIAVTLVLQVWNGEHDWANPVNMAAQWASMPLSLLIVFGLPAVVARLSGRAPVLALLGSAGVAVGLLVYSFAIALIDAAVLPWLVSRQVDVAQAPPGMLVALLVGGLAVIVGGVVFGIAALRSAAVPRVAGVLILVSGIAYAAGIAPISGWVGTLAVVALLAGLGVCGFHLVRTSDRPTATVARVEPQPEA